EGADFLESRTKSQEPGGKNQEARTKRQEPRTKRQETRFKIPSIKFRFTGIQHKLSMARFRANRCKSKDRLCSSGWISDENVKNSRTYIQQQTSSPKSIPQTPNHYSLFTIHYQLNSALKKDFSRFPLPVLL